MRKKDLFEQNASLFEQLTAANLLIDQLQASLEERDAKIKTLMQQMEESSDDIVSPPFEELKQKIIEPPKIPTDMNYGATVIGKTVVEAAKCCNALTADGNGPDVKELVHLILGRTEVAKGEILKLVNSNLPFEQKSAAMDKQFTEAQDYFTSMMAQKP